MTMLSAKTPLEAPRTTLHGLGVKKVKLAIDYDSEERKLKRTVTVTAEVSAEEASQVDNLTKLNATFVADLHVEGYQAKLIPDGALPPDFVHEKNPDEKELDPASDKPGDEIFRAMQTAEEEQAEAQSGNGDTPPGPSPEPSKSRKKAADKPNATKIGAGPPFPV